MTRVIFNLNFLIKVSLISPCCAWSYIYLRCLSLSCCLQDRTPLSLTLSFHSNHLFSYFSLIYLLLTHCSLWVFLFFFLEHKAALTWSICTQYILSGGKCLFVAGVIEQFSVVLLHVLPHLWCPAVLQLWRSCQRNNMSVTLCNADTVWVRDISVFVSFWARNLMVCCLFNVSRNTSPDVMVWFPHFTL